MLSQAELGARAGVARSVIADYERGRHSPSVRQLDRLLAAAGLRLEARLEPLGSDLDSAILRCLNLPMRERLFELPFYLGSLLRCLDGIRYRIEGMAAALLQGAPVPVPVVEIAVADTDTALAQLVRCSVELPYLQLLIEEDGHWLPVEPTVAAIRARGPISRWVVVDGEAQIRLADPDELATSVHVDVDGAEVPVLGLWALEAADERIGAVLTRTRQLVGGIDVGG